MNAPQKSVLTLKREPRNENAPPLEERLNVFDITSDGCGSGEPKRRRRG